MCPNDRLGLTSRLRRLAALNGFLAQVAPFFAIRPWTGVPIVQPSITDSCECWRAPAGVAQSFTRGRLGTRLHN